MRKLISLFLVLVMFLMLAPVTLAVDEIEVTGSGPSWGTGTSLTSFGDRTVTIINTSSATPTTVDIQSTTGDIVFEIGGTTYGSIGVAGNTTVSLDPGSQTNVTVRPINPGVASHTDTLQIACVDLTPNPSSLTFNYEIVNAPAPPSSPTSIELHYYSTKASEITGTHYFPTQYVGYTPGSLTFYIHNTGSQDVPTPMVSLDSYGSSFFEVSQPSTGTLTQSGTSSYVSAAIWPRYNLGVGTYSATVTVTAGTATKSFNVYYSVNSTGGSYSSSYSNRTLADYTTGVRVSGLSIHNSAALSVTQNSLHSAGLCNACDTIRSYMSNGRVLSIYNISLTRGHVGSVNVSIPVSSGYNGSRLTMVHCNGGILESLDVYASNNLVTGTFSSLSPFAVLSGQYINTGSNNNSSNGIGPPKTDDPISYKALGELVILLTAVLGFVVMRTKKKVKR